MKQLDYNFLHTRLGFHHKNVNNVDELEGKLYQCGKKQGYIRISRYMGSL